MKPMLNKSDKKWSRMITTDIKDKITTNVNKQGKKIIPIEESINLDPFDEANVEQIRQEMEQDDNNGHQRQDNNERQQAGEENHSNRGINQFTPTTLGRARSQSESAVFHANKLINRQKYSDQFGQQKSQIDEIDLLENPQKSFGGGRDFFFFFLKKKKK